MMEEHDILVGATFSSYADVRYAIDQYQIKEEVQLYVCDSRTLQGNPKRIPKLAQEAPEELVYYSLSYACVHGGRKSRSIGTGVRSKKCKIVRQGCAAHIHFKLDHTYKKLQVTSLGEVHNHVTTKAAFTLPSQQGHPSMVQEEECQIFHQVCASKTVV